MMPPTPPMRRSQIIADSFPPPVTVPAFIQNMTTPFVAVKSACAATVVCELLTWSNCIAPRRSTGETVVSVALGAKIVVPAVFTPLCTAPEVSVTRFAASFAFSRSFRFAAPTSVAAPATPTPGVPLVHAPSAKGSAPPRHVVPSRSPPFATVGTSAFVAAPAATSAVVVWLRP